MKEKSKQKKKRVLIIDDEIDICGFIKEGLSSINYYCRYAATVEKAVKLLETDEFDAVLLDIRLPEKNGIEILKKIRSFDPEAVVIMLTAVKDLETAVDTMKLGASDYITKPFNIERIDEALKEAFKNKEYNIDPVDENIADIEAIARGVEARQEMFDIHSERVEAQTITLAHEMGIPDKRLRLWQIWRSRRSTKSITNGLIIKWSR